MAAVLLVILKTVGIILLVIVLAVIALLACVMLIPLQYGVSGDIENGKYHIRISWLLKILQFRMDIEDKDIGLSIWIFWKKTGLLDAEKRQRRSQQKEQRQIHKQQREQKKYKKKREKLRKKVDSPQQEKSVTEGTVRIEEKKLESEMRKTDKEKTKEKGSRIKSKPGLSGMSQTVGKVIGLLKEANDKNIAGIIFPALVKMLYHIRPRKMKGDLIFGFQDPSVTGKALGLASWVFFLYQFEEFVLIPDFETDQTYIKGNFQVSGHFRLIHLPVFAFRLIRRKEFRAFVKSLRHSK